MKILIPVDGSENSLRAVRQTIQISSELKQMPQIFLLNVQWNIASGNVKLFIGQNTINDYYREQGMAALATASTELEAAGLEYARHISIGTPAEAIVQFAQEQNVDQIVMSKHGESSLSALLLGSVVNKVLHLAQIPVLLVK